MMVASEVSEVLTTSTSRMAGTGLKKCRPPKSALRVTASEIAPIGKDDVFDAKMHDEGAISSI